LRRNFQLTALASLTVLALLFESSIPAFGSAAQSNSANLDAHPVGAPVAFIIEFGEQYLGAELYDAKITVLEVVRAEKAWDLLKQANASNPLPRPGFDYVLARVRFEFSARTSPAPDSYVVNETQFAATDADGREFAVPDISTYPQPALRGTLKPGDSLEGWLVFLVPKNVSRPLMVFREDVGEVSHRGGGTWLELYTRSTPSAKAKP
jgi:Domain of unknown function (DUF4352)